MEKYFDTICLSSLSKVFPDEELKDESFTGASAFRNETYSFQVAYKCKYLIRDIQVKVSSNGLKGVSVRTVGLVPSELPCYNDPDDYILRSTPGLYPDPLFPIDINEGIYAFPNQWRSLWITVDIEEDTSAGNYPIEVAFYNESGELLGQETFNLEVIPAALPEQKLIRTEWFYTDCLATWYGVEAFSPSHWDLIGKYLENAANHGINMILTPIFTPALETAVGHERPTMQLIGIKKQGDQYSFDFEKLDKWIDLSLDKGVQYFEIAHLFTQWGAKNAPKIIAEVSGETKQIFGWDTDALGVEYKQFLSQLLPALVEHFDNRNLQNKVYFHISDEPHLGDLEHYQAISKFVRTLIKDYPTMDALSNFEFYQSGAVMNPVPSNDVVGIFLDNQVKDLWTYYCCAQTGNYVSNRFFYMPSQRNRVIGVQLYKYNLKGFLHWGYNHWYSGRSIKHLNPYINTDANYSFPSGDAFLVYPGENTPVDSIRHEVFREALQDLRTLQLLEGLIGKEETLEFLEADLDTPITFNEYPRELAWSLSIREKINKLIKNKIVK
jgi:hypothetical protein